MKDQEISGSPLKATHDKLFEQIVGDDDFLSELRTKNENLMK